LKPDISGFGKNFGEEVWQIRLGSTSLPANDPFGNLTENSPDISREISGNAV
jgi:hypothetical protein